MKKVYVLSLLVFINIFSFYLHAKSKYKYEIAICAIFQDDAKWIPEWIEFHERQGVQHFYLYNNLSTDDYKNILKPYTDAGLVEIIDWPYAYDNVGAWNHIQCTSYMDCINNYGWECKWIAVLDTDEYLFNPIGLKLNYVLKEYSHFGAVCANWVMYGTSDIDKIHDDWNSIDHLVYREELNNKHVKSIVRPSRVTGCVCPHFFLYKDSYFAVTEDFSRIDGPFSEKTNVSILRINHYWSRDKDFFFNVKIPRRLRWSSNVEDIIAHEKNMNKIYDPILLFR